MTEWEASPVPGVDAHYVWKPRAWWIERHAEHDGIFCPWSCPFCNPANGEKLRRLVAQAGAVGGPP